MDPIEIKSVLESIIVIHDSREQNTDRARRRYDSIGLPHASATLNYGDYCYNATLPDGTMLFDQNQTISAPCVIERKMDLNELSQCLAQGRDRFRREFTRAAEHGARIYLLIEEASWENLINGKYKTKFNKDAFTGSLIAWMVRYNMVPIMCKKETTGRIIKEILYRDLKERLESGEFDWRLDKASKEDN